MLTDAIERANTAWSEDTALLNEFEKKAETTASKIQIVKNNATEAARSFGEVMLPIHGIKMEQQNYNDSRQISLKNTAI